MKVHMTAPEYAEYVAECAARGQRDDAKKKSELTDAVAVAVNTARLIDSFKDGGSSPRTSLVSLHRPAAQTQGPA